MEPHCPFPSPLPDTFSLEKGSCDKYPFSHSSQIPFRNEFLTGSSRKIALTIHCILKTGIAISGYPADIRRISAICISGSELNSRMIKVTLIQMPAKENKATFFITPCMLNSDLGWQRGVIKEVSVDIVLVGRQRRVVKVHGAGVGGGGKVGLEQLDLKVLKQLNHDGL